MAWIIEDIKCCPRCGNTARVLAIRTGNKYRLSCSWCSTISDPSTSYDVFFSLWQGAPAEIGAILILDGAEHIYKGKKYVYNKISVVNNGGTALVSKIST